MMVRRFMRAVSAGLLDQDPAVLLAHRVGAHRLVGRWGEGLPGTQVEVRAVPRADELAGLDLGAREGLAVVRAAVFHGVQLLAAAHDHHRHAVDLGLKGDTLADSAHRPDVDPVAQNIPVWSRAASDIIDWFQGGSKVSDT